MKLYVRIEAPFEWVRVSGQNVEAFGEVPGLADYPISDEEELVGVVPGEWVTAHRISLPAKSKRQFQAAVSYALEESISEDVEDLHFVCPQWKANEECTVYVVAKEKMREWQSLANEHKLPLDRLVPNYSLVPFHDAAECSLALVSIPVCDSQESHANQIQSVSWHPQIVANHQRLGGVCIDPDFLDVWLMDIPLSETIAVNDQELTEKLIEANPDRDFRHWPFGNKAAHWLEHSPGGSNDLFGDQYRPSVRHISWKAYAVPAGLLIAAIILTGVYDTYRYFALHSEITSIDKEQRQIVKTTFPEIDIVAYEKGRFMMEQALSRMNGPVQRSSPQTMLAEVATVLKKQNVSLANMVYRESELTITCQLNDFSQVDLLTIQLNARPKITAELQSSAADDGEITATYSLTSS